MHNVWLPRTIGRKDTFLDRLSVLPQFCIQRSYQKRRKNLGFNVQQFAKLKSPLVNSLRLRLPPTSVRHRWAKLFFAWALLLARIGPHEKQQAVKKVHSSFPTCTVTASRVKARVDLATRTKIMIEKGFLKRNPGFIKLLGSNLKCFCTKT